MSEAAVALDQAPNQSIWSLVAEPSSSLQNKEYAIGAAKGLGGSTVKSDRKLFPPLIGTGVSMTLGFLRPCGFNTPHVHPRSSDFNVVVEGRLGSEFILENGARAIFNNLNRFQMTVFPQGAVHTEFDPDCTDAIFVAGFANEEPGVQQSAQTLLGLDNEIVNAVFGAKHVTFNGKDVDTFRPLLPANVALGVESCLNKCGIPKSPKRSLGM